MLQNLVIVLKVLKKFRIFFDKAYHLATSGKKGSVHLDLPKCVANQVFENKKNKYFYSCYI